MHNIYDNPEKFGLVRIGEIDLGGGYSSDKFVVWAYSQEVLATIGLPEAWSVKVGWAADGGCSCYTDFNDTGVLDLTWGTEPECTNALKAWFNEKDESITFDKEGRLVELLVKVWNRT